MSEIEYEVVDLETLMPTNFFVGEPQILLILIEDAPRASFERLATKTFKFYNVKQALSFPRVYRSPEEFAQQGFYDQAPFAVHWIGEDLDKPINQLIELWLNSAHELQLETFGSSEQTFCKTLMGVSVVEEILFHIIKQSIASNNYESTAPATVFKLMENISISVNDIVAISGSADFKSIVKSWAMQLLQLDKSFKNEFS